MATPPRGARHASRSGLPFGVVVVCLAIVVVGAGLWRWNAERDVRAEPSPSDHPSPSVPPSASPSSSPSPSISPSPSVSKTPGPINRTFAGITTFRGNASRSYYGEGPVPRNPKILWRYPTSGGLCSRSSVGTETKVWCGTGWTGQPNVIVGHGGSIEVRFGAYDAHYHFLDGRTGEQVRPDLVTGDLAKGSATSDPDGYPLYYGGSRDNLLRVIALDRAEPTVLWSVNADTSVPNPVWNNDWDGAPLVIGDHLLEGGENSWFYVIRLNRGYDANGKVTVHPKIVFTTPGFDDQLMADIPDTDVSIENSVAFRDGVAYFANSGGLVQGWDISDILHGGTHARRVFRFWTGDDTDATIVIDEQGYLYVASELQRFNARSAQVGQLMKLDPSKPKHPFVWGVPITEEGGDGLGGVFATPALAGGMVYVPTNFGDLLGVDQRTGKVWWRIHLPGPTWSSPVPVDGVLLEGDCAGTLHAYDISGDPHRQPPELWALPIGGCIESTPAVWHGMIWVGTRAGGFYGIGKTSA
jgi:outer membrane protein assembly factor BamB